MTFAEFKKSLGRRVLFRTSEFEIAAACFVIWANRGKLIRLRRGIYRLAECPNYDPARLAQLLCPGSYITSSTALEYYELLETPKHNLVISAWTGRLRKVLIEGREYRFLQIRDRHIELPVHTLEGYRLASPTTAFLDLIYRKGMDFGFPRNIKYEGFDEVQIRRLQFSTWIRSLRRPLGQLHMKVTGEKRRLNARLAAAEVRKREKKMRFLRFQQKYLRLA